MLQVERNRIVNKEFGSSYPPGDCSTIFHQQRLSPFSTVSDPPLHSLLAGRAIPSYEHLPKKVSLPLAFTVKRSHLQSYFRHIHPIYPILDPVVMNKTIENYELTASEGSSTFPCIHRGTSMNRATEALVSICLALGALNGTLNSPSSINGSPRAAKHLTAQLEPSR